MRQPLFARIVTGLAVIAAVILVAIAIYACADAIIRKIASTALPGAVDVVGYGLGIVIALGLPYCTLSLAHVSVPVFVEKAPGPVGRILRIIAPLLSTVFFTLMTWQVGRVALKRMESGDQMWMLAVDTWPIWMLVTALLCITTIVQSLILFSPHGPSDTDIGDMAEREGDAV